MFCRLGMCFDDTEMGGGEVCRAPSVRSSQELFGGKALPSRVPIWQTAIGALVSGANQEDTRIRFHYMQCIETHTELIIVNNADIQPYP